VVIFDAGDEMGIPYLAMEFLEGRSLARWLAKGKPMQISHVLHVGVQVTQALAYAHNQGLLHGSVKPSNVFLLQKGRVKVTDFGTANIAARIGAQWEAEGSQPSTPFLSPEVVLGEAVDERSDLYSLGALLYALAAARPPFWDEEVNALMEQIIIKRAVPLRQIRPELSLELAEVVERLMSKEAEARYASAAEVEEALAAIPKA